MKMLTLREPWASAVAHGWKNIENRPRSTKHRGLLLIHAGLYEPDYDEVTSMLDLATQQMGIRPTERYYAALRYGAIIAVTEILDVVTESSSLWFFGKFGYVLGGTVRLRDPIECRGALPIIEVSEEITRKVERDAGFLTWVERYGEK